MGHGAYFDFSNQSFDSYQDIFDSTVANMSENELSAAIGAASVIGSFVGSMLGSQLAKGSGNSSALKSAGSVVGSMVASQIVTDTVQELHHRSVERVTYKENCRRAVERGDPIPDPPSNLKSGWSKTIERTMDSYNKASRNFGERQQPYSSSSSSSRNHDEARRPSSWEEQTKVAAKTAAAMWQVFKEA